MWNNDPMLTWKNAKRLVILVIGSTILLIGVIGVVMPILPGFIFFPIGLGILATEFLWAKRLLTRLKEQGGRALPRFLGGTGGAAPPVDACDPAADNTPDPPPPHSS